MNPEDNMLIGEAELCVILKLWECICLGATVIIHIFHCHYFKKKFRQGFIGVPDAAGGSKNKEKVVLKFISFCFYHCIKQEIKVTETPPHKKCYTAFTRK